MEPLQGCDDSGPGLGGWILYVCVQAGLWTQCSFLSAPGLERTGINRLKVPTPTPFPAQAPLLAHQRSDRDKTRTPCSGPEFTRMD